MTSRFNPNRRQQTRARKARRFERNIELRPDSSTLVRHNLRTRKLKIVATDINDPDGKPVRLRTRIVDNNNLELLDTGSRTLKLTITEVMKRAAHSPRQHRAICGEWPWRPAPSP